jgi:DNA end-binding protein Ku
MEIVRSVRLSEIDPVFFETSYYVVPDRGGEKPYAILFEALKETQHVALARVGMYGREHVVIVRPGEYGILARTMFYTDEIRFESEFRVNVEGVGVKELELAKTFLEAIEAPFACGSRKFWNIISGDVCRCRDFPISGFDWGFDCSLPGEICSADVL